MLSAANMSKIEKIFEAKRGVIVMEFRDHGHDRTGRALDCCMDAAFTAIGYDVGDEGVIEQIDQRIERMIDLIIWNYSDWPVMMAFLILEEIEKSIKPNWETI